MGIRILIVDPDANLSNGFANFLSKKGMDVVTATDGLECLVELRKFRPDVMILDPEICWGGGEGVLECMHAENQHTPPRVIVLTTARDINQVLRVLEFPIERLFLKPVSAEKLFSGVRQLYGPSRIGEWESRIA